MNSRWFSTLFDDIVKECVQSWTSMFHVRYLNTVINQKPMYLVKTYLGNLSKTYCVTSKRKSFYELFAYWNIEKHSCDVKKLGAEKWLLNVFVKPQCVLESPVYTTVCLPLGASCGRLCPCHKKYLRKSKTIHLRSFSSSWRIQISINK
jgi:hypothetical protein